MNWLPVTFLANGVYCDTCRVQTHDPCVVNQHTVVSCYSASSRFLLCSKSSMQRSFRTLKKNRLVRLSVTFSHLEGRAERQPNFPWYHKFWLQRLSSRWFLHIWCMQPLFQQENTILFLFLDIGDWECVIHLCPVISRRHWTVHDSVLEIDDRSCGRCTFFIPTFQFCSSFFSLNKFVF